MNIPENKETKTLEMLSRSIRPAMYRWRIHEGNVRKITEQNLAELKMIPNIQHWVEHHNGNMVEWNELHCTAYYDASGEDVNYATEVQNVVGMEFNIATTDLWIGEEGIGLEVEFTQQQCDLLY